jgi:glutathione peroxidase
MNSVITFVLVLLIAGISTGENFFSFKGKDIKGNDVDFAEFKGKITLVVNSASQCSQTEPHLKALKRLHDILSFGKSFNVVTFPSNDFGEQEPWEEPEIEEYYRGHFKVEFPIMQKTKVIGEDRSDLWSWIGKTATPPNWNFHKYLVNGKGEIVKNWPAETSVETIFDTVKNLVDATLTEKGKDKIKIDEPFGEDRDEL